MIRCRNNGREGSLSLSLTVPTFTDISIQLGLGNQNVINTVSFRLGLISDKKFHM